MSFLERAVLVYFAMRPLRSGDLFSPLDLSSQQGPRGLSSRLHFPKNTTVFEQDSENTRVWILTSGRAQLLLTDPQTKRTIFRPARVGQVFGLTETLARVPYCATMKTLSECSFHTVDYGDLIKLLRNKPGFRAGLLRTLSRIYLDAYKKIGPFTDR
jgi:CRP-like cAMP-binding protein